ncbi:MAG: RdgB/HAM1 family non-canonical purine NTP pyrophosphatase [Clostridia bacterium]
MDLLIASNNLGKIAEFKAMLSDKYKNIYGLKEYGIVCDIEETGQSFEENAKIKATFIKNLLGIKQIDILADDSGLCVDALNGAPSIYSARFSGIDATDKQNRDKLLNCLNGIANRKAYFEAYLVLIKANGQIITANGRAYGEITTEEIGEFGFGYDSIFYSYELNATFASANIAQKDKISHRAKALINLLNIL